VIIEKIDSQKPKTPVVTVENKRAKKSSEIKKPDETPNL
jgi:hypothetical protein